MKKIDHFEQNRPVHLAHRDVCFERASKLIFARKSCLSQTCAADYEKILFLLQTALRHSHYSTRNSGKNKSDEQFGHFISLLVENVKTILSMLYLKGMMGNPSGSFFSFLGLNQASIALQAEEYQQRANDIFHSIHNTLKIAESPFQSLMAAYASTTDSEHLARYNKAHEHFKRLVAREQWGEIMPNSRKNLINHDEIAGQVR